MLIPVIDRYAKGWPGHGDQAGLATYAPLAEVFSTVYDWDAHFAAYSAPEIPHRLAGRGAPDQAKPTMLVFVADVEPAGHVAPTEEWWDAEGVKLAALMQLHPGFTYYETRGGYRLVWLLAQPFPIHSASDAHRWSATYRGWLDYLRDTVGITADRNCSDWQRLYRLPHVVRDGVPQTGELFIGDGTWDVAVRIPDIAPVSTVDADHEWPDASPAVIAHVRNTLARMGPAVEGKGANAHTFQVAATLTQGYALSDGEACALINEWNARNPKPWNGSDLRTFLDNAANYAHGTRGERRAEFEANEKIRAALGVTLLEEPPAALQQPAKVTPTAQLVAMANGSILTGLMNATPAHEPGTYEHELSKAAIDIGTYVGDTVQGAAEIPFFEDARGLFTCDYPAESWLIKFLIADGGTAMIGGMSKTAKSWLATEMAIAVALGDRVCGKYDATRGGVAYFYTEDLKRSARNRIRALLASRGLDHTALGGRLHVQPRGRALDVTNAHECARIIASVRMIEAKHGKLRLLVLDPLRNIHSGKENESDSMRQVFAAISMLGKVLDLTVLLVHHTKKIDDKAGETPTGTNIRGSSAIHGFLDAYLELSGAKNPDPLTMTNTVKSQVKAAASAGQFELTLKIVDDANGEATSANWTIGTKGETNASEEEQETHAEIARSIIGAMLSREILGKKAPLNQSAALDLIKGRRETKIVGFHYACKEHWLRRTGSAKAGVYVLTDGGRAVAREYVSGRPAEEPPAESDS